MKSVYTTGEVAKVCKISQQTVIRCFDSGRLKGFRVPGSRFRRIPRDRLIEFMKANDIPLDQLGSGKKRVLVVDDDPAIVEMFVELLEQDGRFEVRTASTGYDAGILTQECRPDVMILDYKLPDVNGNVVCERIRESETLRDTRILFVSGVVNQEEIASLLDAGGDAFLKKPFDITELMRHIETLLELDPVAKSRPRNVG